MNNYFVIGAFVFIIIAICVIAFLAFKEFKHRKNTTNVELPSLTEIEDEQRKEELKQKREPYDFSVQGIPASVTQFTGEEEINTEEYIHNDNVPDVTKNFKYLLHPESEVPNFVGEKEIELPDLTKTSLDDSSKQIGNVNNDININNQKELKPSETASKQKTSLPSLD